MGAKDIQQDQGQVQSVPGVVYWEFCEYLCTMAWVGVVQVILQIIEDRCAYKVTLYNVAAHKNLEGKYREREREKKTLTGVSVRMNSR